MCRAFQTCMTKIRPFVFDRIGSRGSSKARALSRPQVCGRTARFLCPARRAAILHFARRSCGSCDDRPHSALSPLPSAPRCDPASRSPQRCGRRRRGARAGAFAAATVMSRPGFVAGASRSRSRSPTRHRIANCDRMVASARAEEEDWLSSCLDTFRRQLAEARDFAATRAACDALAARAASWREGKSLADERLAQNAERLARRAGETRAESAAVRADAGWLLGALEAIRGQTSRRLREARGDAYAEAARVARTGA